MQRRDWPAIAGIAMFAVLALGCAFYILAAADAPADVVAGAILVLAAGQIAALLAQGLRNVRLDERLSDQEHAQQLQDREIAAANTRMDRIERQLAQPTARPADGVLEEMRALRDSVQTLAKGMARDPGKPAESRGEAPPQQQRPAAQPQAAPAQERLDLLLEPVIELSTGTTVHYRALINMVNDKGEEVPHAELMRKAGAGGMRPALDAHVLKLALPVLRRLRLKHPAMRLLVPLGAATLQAEPDFARMIRAMEEESDAARGIVFDVAHGDLAGLDATGIEALARLGRLGATMALSRVSVAGLDLASLRQLGVRFLDIDASAFDAGFGLSPAWMEFAQFARAMQFQMVGGGIESAVQAAAATRVARFGYGPYFAPPRRVRSDAGQASGARRTEAA